MDNGSWRPCSIAIPPGTDGAIVFIHHSSRLCLVPRNSPIIRPSPRLPYPEVANSELRAATADNGSAPLSTTLEAHLIDGGMSSSEPAGLHPTCAAAGCTRQLSSLPSTWRKFCSSACQDKPLEFQLLAEMAASAAQPTPAPSLPLPDLGSDMITADLPPSPSPPPSAVHSSASFSLRHTMESTAKLTQKAASPTPLCTLPSEPPTSPLRCPIPGCLNQSFNGIEGECCSPSCKSTFASMYDKCKCSRWACNNFMPKSATLPAKLKPGFCSPECSKLDTRICCAAECSNTAAPGEFTCSAAPSSCAKALSDELFTPLTHCEDSSFIPRRTTGESYRVTVSVICFHLPCDFLSNWFNAPIWLEGKIFTCPEQYMMATKARVFNDTESHRKIMASGDPEVHKRLGRQVKNFDSDAWYPLAIKAVLRANLAKFSQNAHLGRLLLNTGSRILVEASPKDKIWGIGFGSYNAKAQVPEKWRGKNLLGHALMLVRRFLLRATAPGHPAASSTLWPRDPALISDKPLPANFCCRPGCKSATRPKVKYCGSACRRLANGLIAAHPNRPDECALVDCHKPCSQGRETCSRSHHQRHMQLSVMSSNKAVAQLCDGLRCNRIRHAGGRFCSLSCRNRNLNLPIRVQLIPDIMASAIQGYYESPMDYFDRICTAPCRCPAPCLSERDIRELPTFMCNSWRDFWDNGMDNCYGLGCLNRPAAPSNFCSTLCQASRNLAQCKTPGCPNDCFPDKHYCTWHCSVSNEPSCLSDPVACGHFPSCTLLSALGGDLCALCDKEEPASKQIHSPGSVSCDACAPTSTFVSKNSPPKLNQAQRLSVAGPHVAPPQWADALSPAESDATVMPIHRLAPGPTERPITTSDRAWPSAPCHSPEGSLEMPAATPTPAAQDEAHGVSNQDIAELDYVTRSQYLPLMNIPLTRDCARPPQPQKLNTLPSSPEGWLPRKGSFAGLFVQFDFNAEDHGKFVNKFYNNHKDLFTFNSKGPNGALAKMVSSYPPGPAPCPEPQPAFGSCLTCNLPGCTLPPRIAWSINGRTPCPNWDPRGARYCTRAHADSHEALLLQSGLPLPSYEAGPLTANQQRNSAPARRKVFQITLSPQQIELMVSEWATANANDTSEALHLAIANKAKQGKPPHKFRPRCKDLFIPQEAMHPGARGIIWDTEAYFRAEPSNRANIQIRPADFTQPVAHPWNTEIFAQWARESQCPDKKLVSELCGPGVAPPFTGSLTATLCSNSQSFFDNIEACVSKTQDEIDIGFIDTPIPGGLPCFPIKVFKMGAALQFKQGGKIKTRVVGSLSAPYGEHHHLSANAGFDIDSDLVNWPKLDYCSSARIAAYCAIVITACEKGDFVFLQVDWAFFYRQMLRARFGLWLQAGAGTEDGVATDLRWIFGGANCCHEANSVENILIYLIIYRLMVFWGLDLEEPSSWVNHVLTTRPWVTRRIYDWTSDRIKLYGLPGSAQARSRDRGHPYARADEISDFLNLLPAFILGYFDDTMAAGPSRLIQEFVGALDEVVDVLKVEAQMEKSLLAYEDDTISSRNKDGSWNSPAKGSPIVLGKELVLSRRLRKDTAERLATSKAVLRAIMAQAQSNPKREVFGAALWRINGCVQFETDTCKALRSYLRHSYNSAYASDKKGCLLPGGSGGKAEKTFLMQKFAINHKADTEESMRSPEFKAEWCSLKLGTKIPLNSAADPDLEAYLRVRDSVNAEVWLPQRSPPGPSCIFIMSDSAGLEILQGLHGQVISDRPAAGASWFYSAAVR